MSGAKCSWQVYKQQAEGTLVFLCWWWWGAVGGAKVGGGEDLEGSAQEKWQAGPSSKPRGQREKVWESGRSQERKLCQVSGLGEKPCGRCRGRWAEPHLSVKEGAVGSWS